MVTKCGDEAVPAPFLNPPCVHPLLTATLPDPFSSRISLYKVGSISSHEKTERRRDHFCCRLGLASRGTRRLSRPGLWGGDAALRQRVEVLLNAHAAGAFLEESAAPVFAHTLQVSPPLAERPGD